MQQNPADKVLQSCVWYPNPDYETSEQDCRTCTRTTPTYFQKAVEYIGFLNTLNVIICKK